MGYVKEKFSPTGNETADFTKRMSCSDSHNIQNSCTRSQQISAVSTSNCGQQWIFRKEYGNRSSMHWYFLQYTPPDNWIKDCIDFFLFKCPFNLIAFWTQLQFYDFFYYYYSLTPHDSFTFNYALHGRNTCLLSDNWIWCFLLLAL